MSFLYRYFDAGGKLLYVGITLNAWRRDYQHFSRSGWYALATNVTVERHATRGDALFAEKNAIQTERPRFNVANNPCRERIKRAPKTPLSIKDFVPLLPDDRYPWIAEDPFAFVPNGHNSL